MLDTYKFIKRNPDYLYEIINSANYLSEKFAGFIKNFRM